jgi:ribonuclease HI
MEVSSREEADAIRIGKGVVLPPGLYGFTDANHLGGVGVVIVRGAEDESDEPKAIRKIPTCVSEVFAGKGIPGLESRLGINEALGRLRNHLAELAALYLALLEVPATTVTIVHDYAHFRRWMQGEKLPWDSTMREVVSSAQRLAKIRGLELTYLLQPGHRSDWAGRHDLARFNRCADQLATQGAEDSETKESPLETQGRLPSTRGGIRREGSDPPRRPRDRWQLRRGRERIR